MEIKPDTSTANVPMFIKGGTVPPGIELVKIGELKTNPHHARTHSKQQIKKLMAVIREFGFIGVIIIDQDGNILAGHARVEAATQLGMTEIHALRVEHLSKAQLRAYVLADNRIAEEAKWNKATLKKEFEFLVSLDFDLGLTGFDIPEIDLTLQGDFSLGDDEAGDIDALLKQAPITQPGDLWLLGNHQILCGNALNPDDYNKLMAGAKALMCFTDPPYNVPVDGHISGKGKAKHGEFAMASGEMNREEFITFLAAALALMAAFSEDGSLHIKMGLLRYSQPK